MLAVLAATPQPQATTCVAADYDALMMCLEQPAAADPAQRLDVIVTTDIVLQDRQRIVLSERHNLVLRGSNLGSPVSISESLERMNGSGGANRYLIVVSGGSNITLSDVRITDPPNNDLHIRCRAGADPVRRLRWERDPCEAPLWIGDGAVDVELDRIIIDSHKAIQLEVREVTDLTIRRSTFLESTVFGILFHEAFFRTDIAITDNTFRDAGANSIVVHNSERVRIERNRFTDNHRDMQFLACGDTGFDPCSGGQLLVRDHADGPVRDVWIVGNVVLQTDPNRPSATGIEIGNADRAPLERIRIVNNHVQGHVRQGIQVHFGRRPGGHDVLIAGNRLIDNGAGYASLDVVGPQITLNGNSGIEVRHNTLERGPTGPIPRAYAI